LVAVDDSSRCLLDGMSELLLRNVRPTPSTVGTAAVDILFDDGLIVEVGEGLSTEGAIEDCDDALVLPAFTDVHTHLDMTRLGLPFRPHTGGPTLADRIQNDLDNWRDAERSVADGAIFTLGTMISFGATRVRTHAQIDPDSGLERLAGVVAARDAHIDRCHVQIVAFPQTGILKSPGTEALLDEALRSGADIIGGLDPQGFDGDADGHLDIVFDLAHSHGVGVDIHLHDRGEVGAKQIEMICARAAELPHDVTISHCFALSSIEEHRADGLLDTIAAAGVSVATVGPGTFAPMPLEKMREMGIALGLGQDGMRDYWSPYGTGDMLDRTWQLAFTNGFRRDDLIEACVEAATSQGAAIMGVPNVGLAVGDVADVVVMPGDTVTSAVMDRPQRTLVVSGGTVVARDGELV
jgi:cytosine deaminase